MSRVILFDDERSFKAGFRPEVLTVRTVTEAEDLFPQLQTIDELWLDFVLSPGSTIDAFHALKGVKVNKIFFHSSAYEALSLVKLKLRRSGIETPVVRPKDLNIFQPRSIV